MSYRERLTKEQAIKVATAIVTAEIRAVSTGYESTRTRSQRVLEIIADLRRGVDALGDEPNEVLGKVEP